MTIISNKSPLEMSYKLCIRIYVSTYSISTALQRSFSHKAGAEWTSFKVVKLVHDPLRNPGIILNTVNTRLSFLPLM